MNLDIVQKLLQHPDLAVLLQKNEDAAHKLVLEISLGKEKIKIFNNVDTFGRHAWWE